MIKKILVTFLVIIIVIIGVYFVQHKVMKFDNTFLEYLLDML